MQKISIEQFDVVKKLLQVTSFEAKEARRSQKGGTAGKGTVNNRR